MKMNKLLAACCVVLGAQMLPHAALADDLPTPFSFTRYEAILNHSPFAVATAVAVAPTTADFAKDLFIANAAHSEDGDWVALASSTDANFRKYLTTKQGMDGYTLSNIDWSPRVGETKVTVSKDGQFATLSFNQALLSQSIARSAGAGVPVNPNPVVTPGAMPTTDLPVNRIRPAPIPMLPTPPPRVRGVIPRKPLGGYQRNSSTLQPAAEPAAEQPAEVPIEKQLEQQEQ
jgi:hypothetical protein